MSLFKGKTLMITGGTGSFGKHLQYMSERMNHKKSFQKKEFFCL